MVELADASPAPVAGILSAVRVEMHDSLFRLGVQGEGSGVGGMGARWSTPLAPDKWANRKPVGRAVAEWAARPNGPTR